MGKAARHGVLGRQAYASDAQLRLMNPRNDQPSLPRMNVALIAAAILLPIVLAQSFMGSMA